ncbi:WD repeat, SAM and U-box domain-containing protein 1-like [Diachasmimorpha longicaudata]|uniref:WD repeat, SAM and U-box domain-containing protein 1-like n=1 Tax=Diachasmimorpha longicaudata TaxID=58733 RepID=UPI0030B8F479
MEDIHSIQTLSVSTSDINSVDFGGDCILVTGSGDKNVRVLEWQQFVGYQETPYSPLKGHKYGVTCVKVSPQSTMVASASIDGTTILWNLRTGAKIHTMVQPSDESVRVCRFSPDSTFLVTGGDNGQVCLWDLVRRSLVRCFQHHEGAIQGVAFTPDSSWLLSSCTFGVLNLFSVSDIVHSSDSNATGNFHVFATVDDAHDLGVVCCDFSIQQIITSNEPLEKLYQLVTCGNDHIVKLWDVRVIQGKGDNAVSASIVLARVLEKHSSALTCVRFSSNGAYIASCGLDKTIVLWETISAKIVTVLIEHKRYVGCCAFSRDGSLLASGSNDRNIIIWDLSGNHLTTDSKLVKHANPFGRSSIDDDGSSTEPAGKEDSLLRFAESSQTEVRLIHTLDDLGGIVNSVAFHGNNLLASGGGDRVVRLWEVQKNTNEEEISQGNEVKCIEKDFGRFDGHKYSINHVEFNATGSLIASCSLDGTTMVWDTERGGPARSLFVSSGAGIRVGRWSPNGKTIATGGDDEKTTLWDVTTMEMLKVLEGHADAVTTLAFTPDAQYIVTACSEGTWRFFSAAEEDSADNILVCEGAHDLGAQGSDFSPACNAFNTAGSGQSSPDGQRKSYILATGGNDSLVKIWQITISLHRSEESDSERGESELIPRRMSVNGASYTEKKILAGHGGNVMSVKFAPIHGEIIGSTATDKTARLWSFHSGHCLHVMENHQSLVTSCAFSNDTSLFITGSLDRTVMIWRLPQQWVAQSNLIEQLRNHGKKVIDWKTEDVVKWFSEVNMISLETRAKHLHLNGRHLLTIPAEMIAARLHVRGDDEMLEEFKKQLYWLKREDSHPWENLDDTELPYEFLCPITHEIMREPVQCSDGFIYEKAAINEWFLCGKFRSPMTNEPMDDPSFTSAVELRNSIREFIYGQPSDL